MADKLGRKTGGKVKGSLNKKTIEALEIFGDFNFCPLEKILERLEKMEKTMEDELYLNTCLKLMKFKFPERRAVEVTGKEGEPIVPIEQFIKQLNEKK